MNKELYLKNLIEQFKNANGIQNVDINSSEFLKDFKNWITKQKLTSQNMLTVLEEQSLDYDMETCAEIGKGFLDSIVTPYETTIITPYTYKLNKRAGEAEVINGIFKVVDNTPKIDSGNILKEDKIILPTEINRFMFHNPYAGHNIDTIANLHKNEMYNGIIFGVFGQNNDKDKQDKEKMFLDLRAKLYDGYTDEIFSHKDSFCYVLFSDKTKKILSKRR